jgi:hypothetical protein
MNPSIPQSFIDDEFERDPTSANSEYNAQFRSDIDAFISRDVVDAVVVPGRYELGPITQGHGRHSYYAMVDPSGGSSDSFTLAIAHLEGNTAVLDLVRESKPPFSPSDVVSEFAETLKQYDLYRVTGDRYSGEFVRELFSERGISYDVSEKSKAGTYRSITAANSRRVELLDHQAN